MNNTHSHYVAAAEAEDLVVQWLSTSIHITVISIIRAMAIMTWHGAARATTSSQDIHRVMRSQSTMHRRKNMNIMIRTSTTRRITNQNVVDQNS